MAKRGENLLTTDPGEEIGFNEPLAIPTAVSSRDPRGQLRTLLSTLPGLNIAYGLLHEGPKAMERIAHGKLDPMSPEGLAAARAAAMNVVGGAAPFARRGALGAGGGKLSIEDELKALLKSAGVHVPEAKPPVPPIHIGPAPTPGLVMIKHPDTKMPIISAPFTSKESAEEFWNNHHDLWYWKDAYQAAGGNTKPAISSVSATKPPQKAAPLTAQEQSDWAAISKAFTQASKPKPLPTSEPPPIRESVPSAEEIAARRAASPFQTMAYRGLKSPLASPELTSKEYNETYLAAHPEVADLYAGVPAEVAKNRAHEIEPWRMENVREGSNVLPILLDTSNYHTVDAGGKLWGGPEKENGMVVMKQAIEHARENGHPGVIVKNIYDEPSGDTRELGHPTDVYIPLDNRGRLPWADFDPAKWHLKDLLAGFGGIAVPAGAVGSVLQRPDGVHHFLQPTNDDAGAFTEQAQ